MLTLNKLFPPEPEDWTGLKPIVDASMAEVDALAEERFEDPECCTLCGISSCRDVECVGEAFRQIEDLRRNFYIRLSSELLTLTAAVGLFLFTYMGDPADSKDLASKPARPAAVTRPYRAG